MFVLLTDKWKIFHKEEVYLWPTCVFIPYITCLNTLVDLLSPSNGKLKFKHLARQPCCRFTFYKSYIRMKCAFFLNLLLCVITMSYIKWSYFRSHLKSSHVHHGVIISGELWFWDTLRWDNVHVCRLEIQSTSLKCEKGYERERERLSDRIVILLKYFSP
jgi:hypothetical protein